MADAFTPVASGPSYAAIVKTSTNGISINIDLTWCYCENKYKNIAYVEKVQRQTTKASKKEKEKEINKMTQVSLGSRRSSTVVRCLSFLQSEKYIKSNKKG